MNKKKILKKYTILSLSCIFATSALSGCGSSGNVTSERPFSAETHNSQTDTSNTEQPQQSDNKTTPSKSIYVIKSYNIYNEKDTIDHYYNFDYTDNKLTKIEGYDTQGLGITYKTEINDDNNLTGFSSYDSKGAKSEYYKIDLFDNGMLKCENRYSSTDEILFKYDYTYNDNKQIDTKTGYSSGTMQSGKSGYTYNKNNKLIQQTNYSVKGTATSYIKYYYTKNKLKTEKYISKNRKIYYINKYFYNKKGQLTTIKNYTDKKCNKPVTITKYKYNKKGLKTDDYRYNKNNKLEKHITFKYCKIKVSDEKPWYLDWIYNKIAE